MSDRSQLEPQRPSAGGLPPTPTAMGVSHHTGAVADIGEPTELALSYETGVEVEARSQWSYALRRFVRHRLAMFSMLVLLAFAGVALFKELTK